MSTSGARERADRAKTSILESWDQLAEDWDRWTPVVNRWFAPASRHLISSLGLRPGERVVEFAAGSGGFTPDLSRAVGPSGHVLATDGAPGMARLAARNARRDRLENVEVVPMDGERPDLPQDSFDAVTCRQGLMFFPRPAETLRAWRDLLRPGGRIAFSAFSAPARNAFLVRPAEVLSRWAHPEGGPPEPPDAPGPFRLSRPGEAASLLAGAGLVDVRVISVDCPLELPDLGTLVSFYHMILGGIVEDLSPDESRRAWDEVAERCAGFVTPEGVRAPCELVVAAGRRGPSGRSPVPSRAGLN